MICWRAWSVIRARTTVRAAASTPTSSLPARHSRSTATSATPRGRRVGAAKPCRRNRIAVRPAERLAERQGHRTARPRRFRLGPCVEGREGHPLPHRLERGAPPGQGARERWSEGRRGGEAVNPPKRRTNRLPHTAFGAALLLARRVLAGKPGGGVMTPPEDIKAYCLDFDRGPEVPDAVPAADRPGVDHLAETVGSPAVHTPLSCRPTGVRPRRRAGR